jgi:hypothetical protein
VSVTDVENVTDTPVNIRNTYPARAALLESRHTARRVHRRISRDADLRAAAKREVAEQLRRAKQELAGKQGADFGDYLMALAKHAPPEERAARERAQASIKTRDACASADAS